MILKTKRSQSVDQVGFVIPIISSFESEIYTFIFYNKKMADSLLHRITINPQIAHGKPTIRNMRYTVEGMLEYLAGGDSVEELLEEFPDLEKEDLQACLQYALLYLKQKTAELKAA